MTPLVLIAGYGTLNPCGAGANPAGAAKQLPVSSKLECPPDERKTLESYQHWRPINARLVFGVKALPLQGRMRSVQLGQRVPTTQTRRIK